MTGKWRQEGRGRLEPPPSVPSLLPPPAIPKALVPASRYPIPLKGGGTVIVDGPFPLSGADWEQFMAVLNAMKPGLVKLAQDGSDEGSG